MAFIFIAVLASNWKCQKLQVLPVRSGSIEEWLSTITSLPPLRWFLRAPPPLPQRRPPRGARAAGDDGARALVDGRLQGALALLGREPAVEQQQLQPLALEHTA